MAKKLNWNKEWLWNEYIIKEKSIAQIAREQKVGPTTIRRHLIKNDVPIRESDLGKKQYPNLEPSPALAYVLGILDGDGNVSGYDRTQLGVKDRVFAKAFAEALRAIGLRARVGKDGHWNKSLKRQYYGWQCQATSVIFVRWHNGLTRGQREEIATKYPWEYLKGFFESEGTYYISPGGSANVHFSNFNYALLLMVQRLLTALGYDSRIYEFKRKDHFTGREVTVYRLRLLGSSAKKHEFIKRLNPVIKNRPYDYSDPNGLRGRRPKSP